LIASETRRPREEKRHCQDEPQQHEHPWTPASAASGLRWWSWKAIGETFRISASRLRVAQQIKEPVHGRLVTENALARIVSSSASLVSHLDSDAPTPRRGLID